MHQVSISSGRQLVMGHAAWNFNALFWFCGPNQSFHCSWWRLITGVELQMEKLIDPDFIPALAKSVRKVTATLTLTPLASPGRKTTQDPLPQDPSKSEVEELPSSEVQ
jgi:hypothetical protein